MPRRLFLRSLSGAAHFRISLPTGRALCNPSIAEDGNGYRMVVRSVNYTLETYQEVLRTTGLDSVNWLLRLDADLNIIEASEISDRKFRADERGACGFEDARLFFWRGNWWYSASALAPDHPPYRLTMSLSRLNGAEVTECEFIPSPLQAPIEKNWMPAVTGDALHFVYWTSPLQTVSRVGDIFVHEKLGEEPRFPGWHGSSQCISYRGKRLCVIHRRFMEEGRQVYEHAFVEIDGNRIVRASAPWNFDERAIEFCCGLSLAGKHAILSYGFFDREARLLRIPLRHIETMLAEGWLSRLKLAVLSSLRAGRSPRMIELSPL